MDAAWVLMPKATAHLNGQLSWAKDYIGSARQVSSAEPVTKAAPIERRSQKLFRLGVPALDARHVS
jgi:hypothetical protein